MNRSPTYLALLISLLTLVGCANRHTIHTGTFEGEPYELVEIETKGFSTNSIHYEIRSDRFQTVSIDANTTDWGPPYADDLYGNAPRTYLTNAPTSYRNAPDNAVQHPATMLYLDPDEVDRSTFDLYARFLRSEWPTIDKRFGENPYTRFPNLIGVVYGQHDDFRRVFRGQDRDADKAITVEIDGRVRYGAVDLSFEEWAGLSEKVQMPGKRIERKSGGLTPAQLRTYRDESGKTLFDYFRVVEP